MNPFVPFSFRYESSILNCGLRISLLLMFQCLKVKYQIIILSIVLYIAGRSVHPPFSYSNFLVIVMVCFLSLSFML
jgi:hypothetical protein